MCSPHDHASDIPDWLRTVLDLAFKHRATVLPFVALAFTVAGAAGLLIYQLSPTDIERAEADLQKAQAVVASLEKEVVVQHKNAKDHETRAAEHRKLAEDRSDSADTEWLEWVRAKADSHSQLHRAADTRRDNLFHLTTNYLRLLAEAECEILRAKDARDHGTPIKVAPRVRDLLAPILNNR
jgi:hypothetical protein